MSKININTSKKLFPTARDLYGIFFEDISRAGDGGLYPEMLRNRSFEDSLMPEGCTTSDNGKTFVSPFGWIDEFNNGEGMNDWVERNHIVPTPVPAWYCNNATMTLDNGNTLNEHRKVSLKVEFKANSSIENIGYAGVPHEKGKTYNFYAFIKAEKSTVLTVSVQDNGEVLSSADINVKSGDFARYDAVLLSNKTSGDAKLVIKSSDETTLYFGFTSLMPQDTYNGHGLRRDLVEKLRDMHPAFMRFPGGCIVEGFTKETAMYFKNVIGPVWERPSHWLLWHYRTTNGLGFHEYLQLCEDLDLAPLYVCNCGMTCQGRKPYYFNDEEQKEIIEDTLNAIEYAIGPKDSVYGKLRAEAGHEAPFKLEYLEIGNENFGEEYEKRYKLVRKAVLDRYPDLKIIANDRGRGEKLEADIADDHYYNMPEFFAENYNLYENYDRNEPNVFVGEFAVNQTYEGQLRAAISEAMFMVGLERNQDAVKLASYAPLFEHLHYYSWYPNLIIFDNYRSYTIPTYYCWRLFGGNRGKYVVESTEEVSKIYDDLHGLPTICGEYGMNFKNALYNGSAVKPSRYINGIIKQENEIYTLTNDDAKNNMHRGPFKLPPLVALGDDLESREGTFEVEVLAEEGKAIGVGMLCSPKPLSFYDRMNPNPVDPWEMRFLEVLRWMIEDQKSCVLRGAMNAKAISEKKQVSLKIGEYNKLKYVLTRENVSLYVNGELIDVVELPNYQSMCSVVTDSEDEVIIKAVNFSDHDDDIEINLDCDVESDYKVSLLTGAAADENTIDEPLKVHDIQIEMSGAERSFSYKAPALSVNIITLKKK